MFIEAALAGALGYAVLHELIEWRIRIGEKQASCYHDFYEMKDNMGYPHRICRKCKFQEMIRDDRE